MVMHILTDRRYEICVKHYNYSEKSLSAFCSKNPLIYCRGTESRNLCATVHLNFVAIITRSAMQCYAVISLAMQYVTGKNIQPSYAILRKKHQ